MKQMQVKMKKVLLLVGNLVTPSLVVMLYKNFRIIIEVEGTSTL